MPDKEWSPANILDVFGDPIARATLVLASERPVTVNDLADRLDVSNATIYRRIDALVDANFLQKYPQIDGRGNQPNEYRTLLDEVSFRVDMTGYTVDIQVQQDLADDFDSIWTDPELAGGQMDGTSRPDSIGAGRDAPGPS